MFLKKVLHVDPRNRSCHWRQKEQSRRANIVRREIAGPERGIRSGVINCIFNKTLLSLIADGTGSPRLQRSSAIQVTACEVWVTVVQYEVVVWALRGSN